MGRLQYVQYEALTGVIHARVWAHSTPKSNLLASGRLQWAFAEDAQTEGFIIDILANPPILKAG